MTLGAWALAAAVSSGALGVPGQALAGREQASVGSERDERAPARAIRLAPRGGGVSSLAYVPARLRPTYVQPGGAPDAPTLSSRGDGPLTADERARRDGVVQALVQAEALATESPESAEQPLQEALQRFAEVAPLVSDDAPAQEARAYALLALARTRLVLRRPQDAAAAIDEALVTVRGRPLPVEQFGPALAALHEERAAALATAPLASLAVRCSVPCRVLVDEQPFADGTLPPGAHRVWVEAQEPGLPVLRRALTLAAGEAVELPYEVVERRPAPEVTPPAEPERAAPRRILPRWASVLGIAAGTSAAAAGGALVGVDHRCPDLSNPREVWCPRILNTDAGGFALVGVGSAVAITAAILLAIDEVRARRARKRR